MDQEHLVSLYIVDVHDVIITHVGDSHVSGASTKRECCYTFGSRSELEIGNRLHVFGVPNMDSGELSALARRNDISVFATCNVDRRDVILMGGPVMEILSCL